MIRVGIVGAGPAGFYAADALLRSGEAEVDLYDRLATPFGLVRAGVAPDHPNIKAVTRVYDKTAERDGFRFHGHVHIGGDITHEELLAHHHAVLYATGVARDRRLGIPGEGLQGSHAATDFVAWYNGHPDSADLSFDLSGRRAVVIGNGNVALDVARMLLLTPQELAATDIADHALEALAQSEIEEVVVVGRRGPAEAAYTTPELKELGELTDADVVVDGEVEQIQATGSGTTVRNVELVREYARRPPSGKRKRVVLRFLASPVEIHGDRRVEGIELVKNRLEDGRAVATGETEYLQADLVLRSIGYLGEPLAGVPFDDECAVIPNDSGRVLDADGRRVPGVYAAGWIKRGPSGVIGTNKKCANETVAALLEDAAAGRLPAPPRSSDALQRLVEERAHDRVDYADWQRIDEHERATGQARSRPRVKLTRRDEFLRCVRGAAAS